MNATQGAQQPEGSAHIQAADHPPVFVIGVGRSGTTLLSLMMAAHSQLAIPYESNLFVKLEKRLDQYGSLQEPANRERLLMDVLSHKLLQQWDHQISKEMVNLDACTSLPSLIQEIYTAYARKCGKQIWGDKSPGYTAHIDTLYRWFPKARFVHIYRDGRDVALSTRSQGWWSTTDYATHLRSWKRQVRKAQRDLHAIPPEQWLEVSYEALVDDPEVWLRRIAELINVNYEPQQLEAYKAGAQKKLANRIKTGVHKNLVQSVNRKQTYKWKSKLNSADQALSQWLAGDLFDELGYPSRPKFHPLIPFRILFHFVDKVQYGLKRRRILKANGNQKQPFLHSK